MSLDSVGFGRSIVVLDRIQGETRTQEAESENSPEMAEQGRGEASGKEMTRQHEEAEVVAPSVLACLDRTKGAEAKD